MNASTLEIPCEIPADAHNPVEPFLRMDRMPHIWCPACGIGTTVNCFTRALEESHANLDKVAIVSGIGCTGRVAGYANLDSFHTTHGRAIPFATGLKLANPELQVVVYSGDGDLFAIGGNHFIHAARRNMDLKVICVNNLTYAMTGVKQLARSMGEILKKKGFCFIEVLSPCPTLYQRRNKMGDGLDAMKFYKEVSRIRHGAPTADAALTKSGEILVGKFVDRDRPDYLELLQAQMTATLGDRYAEPDVMCSE
jgi:2-oxoglutarate ferredoxin oxidoreductase subunit beta